MSDRFTVSCPELSTKQLHFLARKLGFSAARPALSVGWEASWVEEVVRRGGEMRGIVDHAPATPSERIAVGSPAGSITQPVHTVARVLLGPIEVFQQADEGPEVTIALANLLSCLKPKGRLVIPIGEPGSEIQQLWETRLLGFPGRLTTRTYKTGFLDYCSLAFLLRGVHQISVLEFSIDRKPISRLEWHRYAREAVMQRAKSANAAA